MIELKIVQNFKNYDVLLNDAPLIRIIDLGGDYIYYGVIHLYEDYLFRYNKDEQIKTLEDAVNSLKQEIKQWLQQEIEVLYE